MSHRHWGTQGMALPWGGGGEQGQNRGALLLLFHFRGGGIVPEAKPQPLCRGLKFHC